MSRDAERRWTRAHATLLLGVAMTPHEIGKRIAAAREHRGWTQLKFALEASVSPSTVQRWESGKLPPIREMIRVAGVLGVPPEDLVDLATPGRPDPAEVVELRREVRRLERIVDARLSEILRRLPEPDQSQVETP